jgi:hypothetical protein
LNPEEFIQANVRPLKTDYEHFDLYMYDEIYDDLFGNDDDPTVITQKTYVIQNIIDQIKPEPVGDIYFSMQHNNQLVNVHLNWVAYLPKESNKPWIMIMPTPEQLMSAMKNS